MTKQDLIEDVLSALTFLTVSLGVALFVGLWLAVVTS